MTVRSRGGTWLELSDPAEGNVKQASTKAHSARQRLGRGHLLVASLGVLAVLAAGWHRRWTSDDGLIAVRVAEQILDGNGPVINAGERVEASTSVLWPWLLALFGWAPIELTWVSVLLGMVLSACALAVAYGAVVRLLEPAEPLIPAGMLVFVAVPAFWDFFTSGLETGLAFLWLSAAWLGLVLTSKADHVLPMHVVVLGLGPLVRPELALVTGTFLVTCWLLTRARGRELWILIGLGMGPSALYEIFRAAYFGVLVPNPAIAKEAGLANWRQGLWYLGDLIASYQVWIPIVLLVILGVATAGTLGGRRRVVLLAPTVAGLLMGLYVVRVGGDFMHGRLLLPALLCLLLPVFAIPWRPRLLVGVPVVVLMFWAVTAAVWLRPAYSGTETFHGIVDERGQLRSLRDGKTVVTVADQLYTNNRMLMAAKSAVGPPPMLVYVPYDGWREQRFERLRVGPDQRQGVLAAHALGVTSHIARREDVYVQDLLGLADPVTAHYGLTVGRGRPGHEKWLTDAWIIARYAAPNQSLPEGVHAHDVNAARQALRCGQLAELYESYSAPVTLGRVLNNLTGAFSRTTFRFSVDPRDAVRELC